MYTRNLTQPLLDALSDTPVVLLNGARQTGKSTLAQGLAAGAHPARYVSLDDLGVLGAAQGDPHGFLSGLQGPVVLDEVQRVPELFPAIKAAVDRDRRPGRFLLTGSANVLMLPRLSESLAGRMEILTLWPLSQGEIEGMKEGFVDAVFDPEARLVVPAPEPRETLWERIARGGYPEAMKRSRPQRRRAWFDAYVNTLLQRDVRDLANIEGLAQLPLLLNLLSARSATLLNFSELSRSSQIPQTTLKRYITLLEATFLIHRLLPWSGSLSKRLVKSPKMFLPDTGLAAYLLGAEKQRLADDGLLAGMLTESFVVAELKKQAGWSDTQPRLSHFRTQTGLEVDVILKDRQGRCVGVEVKAGATAAVKDFRGLKALRELLGERFVRGVVLYTGRDVIPFAAALHALPVSALWQLNARTV